ncbi:MAG: hypothetical protein KTR21_01135 [Rhodobacteraceae bacterium]|nr:hypothetical protein [Paracoccaceae bacterium]
MTQPTSLISRYSFEDLLRHLDEAQRLLDKAKRRGEEKWERFLERRIQDLARAIDQRTAHLYKRAHHA